MQSSNVAARTASFMDVVVVNHNTRDLLQSCLETVFANDPGQVVVVDTGSTDGTAEMVLSVYPAAELLPNESNTGYGAAANQGVSRCRHEFVLILNSDTRLAAESLRALGDYLEQNAQVGLCGPHLIGLDGRTEESYFRPLAYHSASSLLVRETSLGAMTGLLRRFNFSLSREGRPGEVGWIVGAALAVRRDAFLGVGGFDDTFFMYSEEVDLCYRLRKAGWEIHYAPVTTIVHARRASTDLYRVKMVQENYKSRLRFSRKHHSAVQRVLFMAMVTYVMARNIARSLLEMRLAASSVDRQKSRDYIRTWGIVLRETWRT